MDRLSEAERAQQFDRLQERLPDVWATMRRNLPWESIAHFDHARQVGVAFYMMSALTEQAPTEVTAVADAPAAADATYRQAEQILADARARR